MTISPEKLQRFEQIERELRNLNARWEKGERPQIPQYDKQEFLEFRGWQAKRLAEKYPLE